MSGHVKLIGTMPVNLNDGTPIALVHVYEGEERRAKRIAKRIADILVDEYAEPRTPDRFNMVRPDGTITRVR